MQKNEFSDFGGIMGRVLGGALSPRSLVTGLSIGGVVLAASFALSQSDSAHLAAPFAQAVVALALARIAINGRWGEWSGTVFSSAGGSWLEVVVVAGRYLTLTVAWILPLLALGLTPEATGQALGTAMQGAGGQFVLDLALIYLVGLFLTPPIFLTVSVAAESFGDLVSPPHWRRLFAGRLTDLAGIYVVYLGALGVVGFLALPLVAMVFFHSMELGLVCAWGAVSFLAGVSIDVLGRLCGFFAFGDSSLEPGVEVGPAAGPSRPVTHSSAVAPASGASPAPAPVVPARVAAAPETAVQTGAAVPPPRTSSGIAPAVPLQSGDGRSPLLDANAPIRAAWVRFETDPAAGLAEITALRDRHAPHPQILHALCLMTHRLGRDDQAASLAATSMPLFFERGTLALATEVFETIQPSIASLALDGAQTLALANALARAGHRASAAGIYAAVLRDHPDETRAIKGLMQIADVRLRDDRQPDDAARIYRFLLDTCAESPLTEYMREGLETAEKRQRTP
ncbi:MAG: hypothetical protein ACE5IK_06220 [Acidobacteriota bacterium]